MFAIEPEPEPEPEPERVVESLWGELSNDIRFKAFGPFCDFVSQV